MISKMTQIVKIRDLKSIYNIKIFLETFYEDRSDTEINNNEMNMHVSYAQKHISSEYKHE